MAKKIFKAVGSVAGGLIGGVPGLLIGNIAGRGLGDAFGKKKKNPAGAAPAPETKGGPIVTPLGGTAPAVLPPRKRKGRGATIVGNGLNETLGG